MDYLSKITTIWLRWLLLDLAHPPLATRALSSLRYYSRRPLPSRGGLDIGPPVHTFEHLGFRVCSKQRPDQYWLLSFSTDPLSWARTSTVDRSPGPGTCPVDHSHLGLSSRFFVPLLIRISRAFHESITLGYLWVGRRRKPIIIHLPNVEEGLLLGF